MKFLTIVITIVCFTIASYAQQFTATYKSDHSTSPVFVKTGAFHVGESVRPPGLRKRNTGRILTIFGTAFLIGGIVIISRVEDPVSVLVLGLPPVAGGVGMMVPGIILWAKGSKKYKRFLESEEGVSFGISRKGLGFELRF